MRIIYLIIICSVMLAAGQVCWKLGMQQTGVPSPSHASSAWTPTRVLALAGSPYMIAGFALYVIATVLWLGVLAKTPLSVAYPMMSISYVFGAFAGHWVFAEPIPIARWIGIGLMCAGVCMMFRE